MMHKTFSIRGALDRSQHNGRRFKLLRSSLRHPLSSPPSPMSETPDSPSRITRRKIRVIARIRGAVQTPSKWISVSKSRHTSSISFLEQSGNSGKRTYELDHCYESSDDNSFIYSPEIRPLVASVFAGRCASVVAFGATGSGKSYTIQGSDSSPGLAVLAMEEILNMADRAAMSVAVSCYEVYHDQVYDMLSRNDCLVSVLEDAQGKIQLKGLSQTFVKSMMDFQKLYVNGLHKRSQKIAAQVSRRSHKGLMIHLFSSEENSNDHQLVGRMNFIDLAGFGDPQRKSANTYTLAENSRINKSLYALQSVVYALNCNDSRVPYRDSKLTYMLRDSLGGDNKILMIACLNPIVCQDTLYMVNLASRCTKGSHKAFIDSLRKVKSAHKSLVNSSTKDEENSMMNSKSRNAKKSVFRKKLTSSRLPLSENRNNNVGVAPIMWDSNQIDEMKQEYTVEKVSAPLESVSDTLQTPRKSDTSSLDISSAAVHATAEMVNCLEVVNSQPLQASLNEDYELHMEKQTSVVHESVDYELHMEKQTSVVVPETASPPLSAKLQELSNYLKSLHSTTTETRNPANTHSFDNSMTSKIDSGVQPEIDFTEPMTPVARVNDSVLHRWEDGVVSSPWTTLNVRSVGLKKCLTEECVRFINSASKEELKGLKGIGDKRAAYIMQLREKSPEHFKSVNDLKDVGLSAKQIKKMIKNMAGDMFD